MLKMIPAIIMTAMLSQNFILVQFLGICPFLGVSKNIKNAFGMGLAVTVVMFIATLITYPLYTYLLKPLGFDYMEIIVFIFVIASLVQVIEIILKKTSKPLYEAMGIYLPLITTNCAVLGVTEENRHHIFLTDTYQMAIADHALGHHIQMEAIRQVVAIGLVHTLVQVVGSLPDQVQLSGIFFPISVKFLLRHNYPKSIVGCKITKIL